MKAACSIIPSLHCCPPYSVSRQKCTLELKCVCVCVNALTHWMHAHMCSQLLPISTMSSPWWRLKAPGSGNWQIICQTFVFMPIINLWAIPPTDFFNPCPVNQKLLLVFQVYINPDFRHRVTSQLFGDSDVSTAGISSTVFFNKLWDFAWGRWYPQLAANKWTRPLGRFSIVPAA